MSAHRNTVHALKPFWAQPTNAPNCDLIHCKSLWVYHYQGSQIGYKSPSTFKCVSDWLCRSHRSHIHTFHSDIGLEYSRHARSHDIRHAPNGDIGICTWTALGNVKTYFPSVYITLVYAFACINAIHTPQQSHEDEVSQGINEYLLKTLIGIGKHELIANVAWI